MTDLTDQLDAIRTRMEATSPGPWEAARGATSDGTEYVTTGVQKAAFLALSLNDNESPLWLVVSDEVIPAATGDGPKAQANAEFIANAPSDVGFLLDLARRQQAQLDAVRRRADYWATLAEGDKYYAAHLHAALGVKP